MTSPARQDMIRISPRRWRLLRRAAMLLAGFLLAGLVVVGPSPLVGLLAAAAILLILEVFLATTRRAAFPLDDGNEGG